MPIVLHCYRCRQYTIPELMSYQFKGPRSCCLGRRTAYCRGVAWNIQNISYEKTLLCYFLLSHSPYLVLIYNIFLNKSVVSPLVAVCMKTAVQGRRYINAWFLSPHSIVTQKYQNSIYYILLCTVWPKYSTIIVILTNQNQVILPYYIFQASSSHPQMSVWDCL